MPTPRSSCLIGCLLAVLCSASSLLADDAAPTFAGLLRTDTRSTFRKVGDYLKEHPQATDAGRAWKWLFVTALDQRLEDDAVPYATQYLKSSATDPQTKLLAQQTLAFGLARSGQGDAAVDVFQTQLRFARIQNGREFVDFGLQLATALRMSGKFEDSKKILDETASKFFLDGEVRNTCENKAAKLGLIGKDAPLIEAGDTKGQPLSLNELRGKVVLVDFWATNCGPCLEEFPNLKELYSEYHEKGFEIVGISLDGDVALVEAFTQRFQIPWRMIVAEAEVERLRERYLVRKIPSLYIVNREGKVAQFDVRGTDLRATIEGLLKK